MLALLSLHFAMSPSPLVRHGAGPRARRPTVRLRFEPCDEHEVKALSGLWSASLNLDDGIKQFTLALDSSGSLTTTEASLSRGGAWERWEARADDEAVRFNLRLGPWLLDGVGHRPAGGGLRCACVSGVVLEGSEDPCHVGSFEMTLSLPAADAELPALEARHRARLDAQPAPPPRFAQRQFCGSWRLLVAMDEADACMPTTRTVQLLGDGTFSSELACTWRESSDESAASDAGAAVLGGRWGVWDASTRESRQWGGPNQPDSLGTHLWLRVERERCTSTLRGIGGLPVHEGFSMWGRPETATASAELKARSQTGGSSDLVSGNCYFGSSSDREWCIAGRFSIMRDMLTEEGCAAVNA